MECMCAQIRSWFILSSERVLGNGVRTHANSQGKNPRTGGSELGGTRDAASHRTASTIHYRLSYPGPRQTNECYHYRLLAHMGHTSSLVRHHTRHDEAEDSSKDR